jgi:UDP-N-acetyl-D-glucosamine dehydrogenase
MQMPEIVGKKVIEILGDLKDKKILIEGISYKPNIADIRESAALRIFEQINNLGAKISWHDPLIETWKFPKSKKPIEYFDLIIVCVIHDKTNLNSILEQGVRILDLTGRVPNSPKVINF